jgi:hypothetical protein
VTPSGSRPGSVLSGTAGNQQWEIDGVMGSFSNGKGKAIVTEAEVREEKEKAALRATFVPYSLSSQYLHMLLPSLANIRVLIQRITQCLNGIEYRSQRYDKETG